MRRVCLILGLAAALAGCGGAVPPTAPPAAPPIGEVRGLSEIGRGDFDGAVVTALAPVLRRADGQVLVPALNFSAAEPAPLLPDPAAAVVVGGDPLTGLAESGGVAYGVVRVSGPVQLGADGVRQIQPTSSKVLAPAVLTLADLQKNSTVYQGQVVEVPGTLIVKAAEALLVEAAGPGGVPAETAAQIKILHPFDDPELFAALDSNAAIRYGPVTVTGLWHGNGLQVFWARR
ncbi:MAG TPA: hypothetical protein VD886_18635 [Herpetosiphonaceae bacterium]|nr:hypothetical protein [Herpetosiphonaceae bacterium]